MTALHDRPTAPVRYSPEQRLVPGARPVLLTGVQAIARLLVEQSVRDAAAGRRVESLVSGYPGSPLAGLDKLLHSHPQLKTDFGVHLVPGLNEELGATAVWGSQQVPGKWSNDGVLGVWYGKGPGVDRSGDVLRHGNTYGAHAEGGVLVLAGDDPAAKSSSVPCTSERTLASFGMPVLTPRTGEEVIAFGLYGVALSRLSGCWTGLKVLADVADGLWTVDRDFAALPLVVPTLEWQGRPWTYEQRVMQDPRDCVLAEADLLGPRWAAVQAFGAANPLDEVTVPTTGAWLGIVSTGTAYDATLQALHDLGLGTADLAAAGVRVLRVGMPYPLGAARVREFAAGLERILVVEEKTAFLETQMKEILYGVTNAPAIHGKQGPSGQRLVPADGQVTADRLDSPLRSVLGARIALAPLRPAARGLLSLTPVARAPYFCSGCPHNRSTVLPEGSIGGGGIGCHALVTVSDRPDSQVVGLTQMGGEGSQWIGQAPFTDVGHIFQNVGDGTFAHSGQLAVQACVAAGVDITYKILYNSAVAMTGAQNAEGSLPVPALTRKLAAEGVSQVVIVTDEPRTYRRVKDLATGVTVRDRDDLDAVQRELRQVPGVTVIVYDQQCANEARRLRKRGKQQVRTTRVVIDEATCEGCGDCGTKSNCLSVQPVDTEFGRKTRIDQTSCNTDYSCLDGDCPSFLTVQTSTDTSTTRPTRGHAAEPPEVQEPERAATADVLLAGIGGTGIVTVNQLLATAALRSDLVTSGLDQVGLSQKAGPVTSHLRVGARGPANRVGADSADLLLAFDLLVAADTGRLAVCSPDTTIAVVSTSTTPTGAQVADPQVSATDARALLDTIRARVATVTEIDALQTSKALFGTTAPANLLLVGAAYQAGALPFPAAAVEEAIELNGVSVTTNLAAFRWGRVAVADRAALDAVVAPPGRPAAATFDLGGSPLAGETRRSVEVRAQLLLLHSGRRAATRFVRIVEEAWEAERKVTVQTAYSEAVSRGLAHVLAYKDEYEVARLLTRPELLENVQAQVPGATKVTYNLHPPVLRSLGMHSKLQLGASSRPLLRLLAKGKVLRGTALDPFGRAQVRRVERQLVRDHTALVRQLTSGLTQQSYQVSVRAAAASELIRGYEDIKLANVDRYRASLAGLDPL